MSLLKGKKTWITAVLLLLAAMLMLSACGKPEENDGSEISSPGNEEKTELPKDKIIFVYSYSNGAWGYSNSDVFIDTNGDVYSCCNSQPGFPSFDNFEGEKSLDAAGRYELAMKYSEPIGKVEMELLKNFTVSV